MATQLNSAVPVSIQYHHEGEMHELIITTRFDGSMQTSTHYDDNGKLVVSEPIEGENAIVACDELTRATVRAWCQAWSAIKHHIYDIDYPSPCHELGIALSDSEPYCTVWNKNYKGLTITVQSSKPPLYAVIAAIGQAMAINAIHDSVKSAGVKDKPDTTAGDRSKQMARNKNYGSVFSEFPDEQADDTPWRDVPDNRMPNLHGDDAHSEISEQVAGGFEDAESYRDHDKDGYHESLANHDDFSGWKYANFQTDGSVFLPMKKANEVRMAIRANANIPYDKDIQYEHEQIVVYPFGRIERRTVGNNNIPVIDINTGGFGTHRIWCYKAGSDDEEKTYDYQEIIKYFKRVGIDATTDDFAVEYNAQVAMKINHYENKEGVQVEAKNVYGFWNNPLEGK